MSTIEQRLARLEADLRQHYHLMPSQPDGNGLPVSLAMLPSDPSLYVKVSDEQAECHVCGYRPGASICSAMHEDPKCATPMWYDNERLRAELAAMSKRAEKAEFALRGLPEANDDICARLDAALALLRDVRVHLYAPAAVLYRDRIDAMLEKAK
jgi:hypothetical protein